MKYSKVFIVGSPRSGTHWLRRIFQESPEILSNDYESNLFKVVLGPFVKSKLPWNRSWKTVKKNYNSSHLDQWIPLNLFKEKIDYVNSIDKVSNVERAQKLIQIILDEYYTKNKSEKSRILLEKTPGHLDYGEWILDQFPEAKLIEIVRDGRNVVASLKKLRNYGETWVPKHYREQILLWSNAIQKGFVLKKKYRFRMLTVRYEDLIINPYDTIYKISDFVEISSETNSIDKLIAKNTSTKNNLNEWASYLSQNEQRVFKKIAGRQLIDLKYVENNNW